jgi:hypothetical protein
LTAGSEQAELEAWWGEMERRVLAGELIDPDPRSEGDLVPDAEVARAVADDDLPAGETRADRLTAHEAGGEDRTIVGSAFDIYAAHRQRVLLDERAAGIDRVAAVELVAGAPPSPPPEDTVGKPGEGPPPDASPDVSSDGTLPADGWWQAADRAVSDASLALLRSQLALGHARQLVHTAVAADALDEASWQDGPHGRLTEAGTTLDALRLMTAEQTTLIGDLLAATAGGGLADRPRLALTDALSGALLALTDLPGLTRAGTCGRPACRRHPDRCTHDLTDRPGLGPPAPTDGYRPGAELDRYLRARDRRCRFPGCRRRVPAGGELDHHIPYPLGATSAENLAGYCTGDHRGKHQASGWTHDLAPDGTLTVTTPTGLVASTSPPPF